MSPSSNDKRAEGGVHPLAKPFLALGTPRAGLIALISLGVVAFASFAIEFLAGGKGFTKYPEVFGTYEFEVFAAFLAGVGLAWPVRWLLSRRADYYEREDGDA